MQPALQYVSRGGLKLKHALDTFAVDVTGMTCADLGCSTGGFTDCLLQSGATKVHAVDTAYGELAWKLRQDSRVHVMERQNALHATPPADGVDLVVVDLGWTPQHLLVPAALKWLRPGGRIVSLVKPHYELKSLGREPLPPGGVLDETRAEEITDLVIDRLLALGVCVLKTTKSPILGGARKNLSSKTGKGNAEWLVLLASGLSAWGRDGTGRDEMRKVSTWT